MGTLEKESRKRTRRNELQKILLETVKAAGFLSVALLAPNAVKIFRSFGFEPTDRRIDVIHISRKRLVKAGLLHLDGKFLRLTEKGERKLSQLERVNYRIKKPRHWDKKWRVLIFDIPEKRKGTREKLRSTLSQIGFVRLQDSVWVYPYDCEDLVTLLKADYKIGKDLLYMIVDSIEYDFKIRKSFGLGVLS